MNRSVLSIICGGSIARMIQLRLPGFNYEPRSDALRKYIKESYSLLVAVSSSRPIVWKQWTEEEWVEYADGMHRLACDFRTERAIQESVAVNLETSERFSMPEEYWDTREMSVAWMKHYIATHANIRLNGELRGFAERISRMLAIDEALAKRAVAKLVAEKAYEILHLDDSR